jgi:1-deoxy-D-xylulose-5-phosphate synthase
MHNHPTVLTIEEGQVVNGFGAFMAKELNELNLKTAPRMSAMGLPDSFIEHGARKDLLADIGLDVEGMVTRVRTLVGVKSASLMETA